MEDIELMHGDCLDILPTLEAGSVDAIVTDPPAGIGFMGKAFDSNRGGRDQWVAWLAERLAEAHRVARPGAYALVWALPRTSHWTGMAIEDAGWTIRDRVSHLFGQGFPKAKSCLKPACEDWWLAWKPAAKVTPLNIDACRIETSESTTRIEVGSKFKGTLNGGKTSCPNSGYISGSTSGRWPANVVLSHHEDCRLVGARRIKGDARIGGEGSRPGGFGNVGTESGDGKPAGRLYGDAEVEAWDCVEGCAVAELDRQTGTLTSGLVMAHHRDNGKASGVLGKFAGSSGRESYGDSGGASRFFYTAKASKADRGDDNNHPTVKSTDLMRWLCRLITPPGGTIADPFMGSGSTGKAAVLEGFRFIGIESDPGYFAIAERRIDQATRATPLFA